MSLILANLSESLKRNPSFEKEAAEIIKAFNKAIDGKSNGPVMIAIIPILVGVAQGLSQASNLTFSDAINEISLAAETLCAKDN